jgi:hypothetical protein
VAEVPLQGVLRRLPAQSTHKQFPNKALASSKKKMNAKKNAATEREREREKKKFQLKYFFHHIGRRKKTVTSSK